MRRGRRHSHEHGSSGARTKVDAEIERLLIAFRRAILWRRIGAYSPFAVWMATFILLGWYAAAFPSSPYWQPAIPWMFAALSLVLLCSVWPSGAERRISRALSRFDNAAALGALLETYWNTDWARKSLRTALTACLRSVKASDRTRMTDRQYAVLRALVPIHLATGTLGPDAAEFHLALLHAVEQVGDLTFAQRMANLATLRPKTPTQRRIHDAARAALETLNTRTQSGEDVLLRATTADEVPNLLRPASDTGSEEAAQLLRASNPSTD